MTNHERMKAFQMRLDGASWEDIGEALGYSGRTVYGDLRNCMKSVPRQPNVIYPAIRKMLMDKYGGSINSFSIASGVSANTLYSALKGKHSPSKAVVDAILKETGLSYEEAFRNEVR